MPIWGTGDCARDAQTGFCARGPTASLVMSATPRWAGRAGGFARLLGDGDVGSLRRRAAAFAGERFEKG